MANDPRPRVRPLVPIPASGSDQPWPSMSLLPDRLALPACPCLGPLPPHCHWINTPISSKFSHVDLDLPDALTLGSPSQSLLFPFPASPFLTSTPVLAPHLPRTLLVAPSSAALLSLTLRPRQCTFCSRSPPLLWVHFVTCPGPRLASGRVCWSTGHGHPLASPAQRRWGALGGGCPSSWPVGAMQWMLQSNIRFRHTVRG